MVDMRRRDRVRNGLFIVGLVFLISAFYAAFISWAGYIIRNNASISNPIFFGPTILAVLSLFAIGYYSEVNG